MIKNGPKIKLKSAPGRRSTSVTSLPTNAVVRVQLLSGPSRNSLIVAFCRGFVFPRLSAIGTFDQRGENLVERRPIFAAGFDTATGRLDRLDHARRSGGGLVGEHQDVAGGALAHLT